MLKRLLRNIILALSSCDTGDNTKVEVLNINSKDIKTFGRIDETNSLKRHYCKKGSKK